MFATEFGGAGQDIDVNADGSAGQVGDLARTRRTRPSARTAPCTLDYGGWAAGPVPRALQPAGNKVPTRVRADTSGSAR
ncbi:hypothetical protein K7G98_02475 [Saccharothrix sp. MB29]|nr:hypothetical protein [Saccharothrix sp. MB29]